MQGDEDGDDLSELFDIVRELRVLCDLIDGQAQKRLHSAAARLLLWAGSRVRAASSSAYSSSRASPTKTQDLVVNDKWSNAVRLQPQPSTASKLCPPWIMRSPASCSTIRGPSSEISLSLPTFPLPLFGMSKNRLFEDAHITLPVTFTPRHLTPVVAIGTGGVDKGRDVNNGQQDCTMKKEDGSLEDSVVMPERSAGAATKHDGPPVGGFSFLQRDHLFAERWMLNDIGDSRTRVGFEADVHINEAESHHTLEQGSISPGERQKLGESREPRLLIRAGGQAENTIRENTPSLASLARTSSAMSRSFTLQTTQARASASSPPEAQVPASILADVGVFNEHKFKFQPMLSAPLASETIIRPRDDHDDSMRSSTRISRQCSPSSHHHPPTPSCPPQMVRVQQQHESDTVVADTCVRARGADVQQKVLQTTPPTPTSTQSSSSRHAQFVSEIHDFQRSMSAVVSKHREEQAGQIAMSEQRERAQEFGVGSVVRLKGLDHDEAVYNGRSGQVLGRCGHDVNSEANEQGCVQGQGDGDGENGESEGVWIVRLFGTDELVSLARKHLFLASSHAAEKRGDDASPSPARPPKLIPFAPDLLVHTARDSGITDHTTVTQTTPVTARQNVSAGIEHKSAKVDASNPQFPPCSRKGREGGARRSEEAVTQQATASSDSAWLKTVTASTGHASSPGSTQTMGGRLQVEQGAEQGAERAHKVAPEAGDRPSNWLHHPSGDSAGPSPVKGRPPPPLRRGSSLLLSRPRKDATSRASANHHGTPTGSPSNGCNGVTKGKPPPALERQSPLTVLTLFSPLTSFYATSPATPDTSPPLQHASAMDPDLAAILKARRRSVREFASDMETAGKQGASALKKPGKLLDTATKQVHDIELQTPESASPEGAS